MRARGKKLLLLIDDETNPLGCIEESDVVVILLILNLIVLARACLGRVKMLV
jgi:hypothetical protein